MLTHFKIKNSNFQTFHWVFAETNDKVKRTKTRIKRATVYSDSSEGNSCIAKPKLEEFLLILGGSFENSYTVDTHQKM